MAGSAGALDPFVAEEVEVSVCILVSRRNAADQLSQAKQLDLLGLADTLENNNKRLLNLKKDLHFFFQI